MKLYTHNTDFDLWDPIAEIYWDVRDAYVQVAERAGPALELQSREATLVAAVRELTRFASADRVVCNEKTQIANDLTALAAKFNNSELSRLARLVAASNFRFEVENPAAQPIPQSSIPSAKAFWTAVEDVEKRSCVGEFGDLARALGAAAEARNTLPGRPRELGDLVRVVAQIGLWELLREAACQSDISQVQRFMTWQIAIRTMSLTGLLAGLRKYATESAEGVVGLCDGDLDDMTKVIQVLLGSAPAPHRAALTDARNHLLALLAPA